MRHPDFVTFRRDIEYRFVLTQRLFKRAFCESAVFGCDVTYIFGIFTFVTLNQKK